MYVSLYIYIYRCIYIYIYKKKKEECIYREYKIKGEVGTYHTHKLWLRLMCTCVSFIHLSEPARLTRLLYDVMR